MGTPVQGRISKVELSFDGGTSYNNLAGCRDISLNTSVDEIESTDHDSTSREYIPNFLDATMDLTINWEEDDTVQAALLAATVPSPTSFKMRYFLNSGAGNVLFSADAFCTSYNVTSNQDGVAESSLSWRLSGITVGVTV